MQTEFQLTDAIKIGGNFVYSDPKFGAGAYDGGTVTQCVVGAPTGAAAVAGAGANGCPPQILITRANGTVAAVPSLEGRRAQRSVKTQWNLHAALDTPLSGDWRMTGRVDISYTGPAFNNLANTIEYGKRTLTNVRLGFDNGTYAVSLFANNLLNEKYVQNSINQPRIGFPFTLVIPEIYLGETRRVGVTASYKF
jgi:iron complex outermembrane recepter protein